MAKRESINAKIPSNDELQAWANDSERAQENLRGLLAAIEAGQEESANWATEALENMGPPSASDIGLLGSLASSRSADLVYWSVTLLARCDDFIDSIQDDLAKVVVAEESTAPVRRRAMTALAKVRSRNASTESAIQSATSSSDSQLANLAKEILQPV